MAQWGLPQPGPAHLGWRAPHPCQLTSGPVEQYLPILLLMLLCIAFALGSAAGSRLLSPRRPTGAKEGAYESGIVPRYHTASRFPVRFYLVAMIFIIFDIEVIFLYPWAVMYHQLSTFGLAEMAAFAVVVFIAFAYLVSNGALDWGPRQKRGGQASTQLTLSTTATVRRVPRPIELIDGVAPRPVGDEQPAARAGSESDRGQSQQAQSA
jgi:NADH-quinone oxidoreductase subunit A